MSYQVLARKWRPRNFATLVGQEHVVRALTHALTEKRLHHAYLFTGTRGVGKTTIARILAKSLNCETGITALPCGVCSACTEIDSGRFVDLLEVDAATNTRVDEMRQLLENAVYAPTRGRYKVYVIDEVHMLSNSAFNAMLKTLEEPPEHVKFVLATTDPQKIPVTVLSRCLQFNLKQMPPASIVGHMGKILDAEGVPYDATGLSLLARSAAGSMRDALSLLDQAIAHGAGKVDSVLVQEMLGTADKGFLLGVFECLLNKDAAGLLAIASGIAERSLSYSAVLQELAEVLTQLQVIQFVPSAFPEEFLERDRWLALATAFGPEWVQLAYQIVIQGRQELAMAPDEYSGFLMTLFRLHAFRPDSGTIAGKRSAVPAEAASPRIETAARPAVSAAKPAHAAMTAAAPSTPTANSESQSWSSLLSNLKLGGLARELAQHCELRALDGSLCQLRLPPLHRHLVMRNAQDKIEEALTAYVGRPITLRIEIAEVEGITPAVAANQERQESQARAVAAIEKDPFVREVIETMDASLVEASIKPLS